MRTIKTNLVTITDDNEELKLYYNDIKKKKMLSMDEEVEICERIKNGDERAENTLIVANLRFVVSIAKQYKFSGVTTNDLISEGNIGLIKAAHRFDPSRGFKFISYAVWWIRQSIIKYINNNIDTIYIPLNRKQKIMSINKIEKKYIKKYNRRPTNQEISEELNLDIDEVKICKDILNRNSCDSLDAPVSHEGQSLTKHHFLGDESFSYNFNYDSLKVDIQDALNFLSEKEVLILKMYFGINQDNEGATLDVIGHKIGMSKERVRQIKEKALKKIRLNSISEKLKEYL